ncbi:hypothetical protein EV127DRAFT_208922 [Xylaria flabelliformis]|nr:hypothetical protein EV127DRAFT_208922 [Xylaria flabelliformis]
MCVSASRSVHWAITAIFVSILRGIAAQDASYSPLRPPAIPLAVRNPYTNVWAANTATGGTLNSQTPSFWTTDPVGWEGVVVVDDTAYEYLGSTNGELPKEAQYASAVPLTVKFDSQSSNFTFTAGPVIIEASFLSPVTPKDVCRSSIPLSYLTTSVRSNDGQPHHIRFYSDVSSKWLGVSNRNRISWDLKKNSATVNATSDSQAIPEDLFTWLLHRQNQLVFGEESEFPQWGDFAYTTSPSGANSFSFECGEATAVRLAFFQNRTLSNNISSFTTDFGDHTPVFAFAHDFGVVDEQVVRYTVGSAQNPIIQFITDNGLTKLAPWWSTCYGDIHAMIRFHWEDYGMVRIIGDEFEKQLQADVRHFYEGAEELIFGGAARDLHLAPTNGTNQYGQQFVFDSANGYGFLEPSNWTGISIPYVSEARSYYSIVALSARQVMGAYVFAQDPNTTSEDPLVFQKEISSNGNVNTVDVLYPASPFFLYANPNLLRYALQPLYEYQEGQFYPNGYCIHDIGARFPNATGHVDGADEYMPVEESANFIIMSYAYYKFTGDASWLTSHYDLLRQFTRYLIDFSLVPEAQLSTDDFAGTLLNQTNLAIKGIIGLQAMSYIATVAKNTADATDYANIAKSYYEQWEYFAIEPSHKHTTLAYQWRSSWGLLYNIYFDKLLNMGFVNQSVYTMQSNWYPSVSQLFGIPLDSRHDYTKTDWQIWTAATSHADTRRLFINSIAYWLNETVTGGPFTDLYKCTGRGDYAENAAFKARPVVGGHFAFLALLKTGQRAGAEGGDTSGSLFPRNSPQPLPIPDTPIPPAQMGFLTDEEKRNYRGEVTTLLSSELESWKRWHRA